MNLGLVLIKSQIEQCSFWVNIHNFPHLPSVLFFSFLTFTSLSNYPVIGPSFISISVSSHHHLAMKPNQRERKRELARCVISSMLICCWTLITTLRILLVCLKRNGLPLYHGFCIRNKGDHNFHSYYFSKQGLFQWKKDARGNMGEWGWVIL